MGMFLQHVHFQSLSLENLLRLGHTILPGQSGGDLHREVADALTSRKRSISPGAFQSKRRRLQHWSPFCGASSKSIEASRRVVLAVIGTILRWHKGELFVGDFSGGKRRVLSWKLGDRATSVRCVAGEGADVTGINDLGSCSGLAISPSGEILVADKSNQRLVRYENGSGHLALANISAKTLFYSHNGLLYQDGQVVQKLVGSKLQTVIASENFPADMQFSARMFVNKEEVIYILDEKNGIWNGRILRINPAEPLEPVVVGHIPGDHKALLTDLFVTEAGTIYVVDMQGRFLPFTQATQALQKSCSVQVHCALGRCWFRTHRCMWAWRI